MDIKDSYLHGTVGVVKSISVSADKLKYKLADIAGTVKEVTLPVATTSANGLMSSGDKTKLDNLSTTLGNYVTLNTDQEITGTKTFTKQLKFTVAEGTAPFLVTSTTTVANLTSNYSEILKRIGGNVNLDANIISPGLGMSFYGGYSYKNASNLPEIDLVSSWQTALINFGILDSINAQLFIGAYDNYLYYRRNQELPWRQIAYTNSNITGNAATATHASTADKLKTKRKLWGLDFDGTADISGNLTGVKYLFADPSSTLELITPSGSNLYIYFRYNNNDLTSVALTGSGFVPTAASSNKITLGATSNKWKAVYATDFIGNLDWSYITNKPTSFTPAAHDHTRIINTDTTGRGIEGTLLPSKFEKGLTFNTIYGGIEKSWPVNYGNVVTIRGNGDNLIVISWNSSQTETNTNVALEMYIRSKRDSAAGDKWSDWTRVITDRNYPEYCASKSHTHTSDQIIALTGYSKAESASDLAATDTLNAALGKLEYKAHYAYDWVIGVTATDTDEYINKWSEIVGFLDSVKEGTDITDEFVTRKTDLEIIGNKTFIVSDWKNEFFIKRDVIGSATITYANTEGVLGHIGVSASNGSNSYEPLFVDRNTVSYKIYHTGNLKNLSDLNDDVVSGKYLPLSGGQMTGNISFLGNNYLYGDVAHPMIYDANGFLSVYHIDKATILGAFGNGTTPNIATYIRSTGDNLYHRQGNYNAYRDYRIWDEGNLTPTEILAQLKTVDGTGSGLDADLLDGIHSFEFVRLINAEFTNSSEFLLKIKEVKGSHLVSIKSKNWNVVSDAKINWGAGLIYSQNSISNTSNILGEGILFSLFGGTAYILDCIGNTTTNYVKAYKIITENILSDYNIGSATKLQTPRLLWGLSFDGTANVSGDMTNVGAVYMTGDISIKTGDSDRFVIFDYDGDKTAGASWRVGMLGTGSSDTNYFVVLSGTSATAWNNAIRIGQNSYDIAVAGNLYPLANNTKTLGTSSLRWSNIYSVSGNYSGNITLYKSSSGDSPHLVFLRGTTSDGSYDWRIYDTGGFLKFQYCNADVWTEILSLYSNGIKSTAFIKSDSSDSYVLLGGGGHKTISSLSVASANKLNSTEVISAKAFSLSNTSWTDTGYTFASLASGTYAIQVTCGNLVASGIMSVYKNIDDTAGDEIPLHVYHDSTQPWRPYLRTSANKLLISSNDASATSRTVTIKIALIL